MSLSTNVSNLATRIATEVKALRTLVNGNVADLSSLTTTEKTNLVAAVNELKNSLDISATIILGLEDNVQTLDNEIGTLSSLTTTAKNNLVAAINELQAELDNIDVSGQVAALIDDTATSTTKVWSSSKTSSEISSAVSALVDGAPALLDTLNELAAAINDDASFASTVTAAIATKADDSAVVKLTGDQTVAGIKTFSSAPVVPDASFAIAKVSGLQSALDSKASAANVGDTTVNYVTTFEAGLV